MNKDNGEFFTEALQRCIRDKFLYVDRDAFGHDRIFFENAGGSLRLKAAVEAFARIDAMPDSSERIHEVAAHLKQVQKRGTDDFRTVLNAHGGAVFASMTASSAMFDMVRAVAENVPGDNLVTTVLEHPSSYDAMSLYADRLGKQLRVARSNPATGGVDVDEIVSLIDERTCLLSVIYASNISGAKLDVAAIVQRARAIKHDLYIVVDAVQHAPHDLIDVLKTPVDGINVAPYKFFGCRGFGFSWMSDRAAALPHHKLAATRADVWDLGSTAPWQFAVMTEVVNYVCWLGGHFTDETDRRAAFACGMERIALHERALLARMLDGSDAEPGLRQMDGVKVFLDHEDLTRRDLILAIAINGLDPAEAVREYEKRGVIVYERVASSLYSKRMLESFGIKGAVRISPLHCHAPSDVDRFLRVTQQVRGSAVSATKADA